MSYRSRRKSYRGSPGTNFVRQRYQYFVDMQTKADSMQVIKVTAGGVMPQIRLRPFFTAFKYFKLGTVRIRFVPAATLPVDPTGLSYEEGEQTVDPRDQMNPGLVRITNGEDVSSLTEILTGVNAERAYYTTMLDSRWYKFQLQSGFKRSAKPLLWNVGQTHQSISQGLVDCQDALSGQAHVPSNSMGSSTQWIENYISDASGNHAYAYTRPVDEVADGYPLWNVDPLNSVLMQTGRIRMGWMPTDVLNSGVYGPNAIPEVDLMTVILPKAYKTSYFYRVYIEEEILFKDAVSSFPVVSTFTGNGESLESLQYLNFAAIDRFLVAGGPTVANGNNPTSSNLGNYVNHLNGGSS